jgi:hypothetical protein
LKPKRAMRVALGLKAHSGWAALVVLGRGGRRLQVIDRRRLELVEEGEAHWAKQPYHAAGLSRGGAAREVVKRGIQSARSQAAREIGAAVKRASEAGHAPVACAVLTTAPMPHWSVEEILAVHLRMHQAEGALFREALSLAGERCGLRSLALPEKLLDEHAEEVLASAADDLRRKVAELGRDVGPPWGKDQKDAALAAWVALAGK